MENAINIETIRQINNDTELDEIVTSICSQAGLDASEGSTYEDLASAALVDLDNAELADILNAAATRWHELQN